MSEIPVSNLPSNVNYFNSLTNARHKIAGLSPCKVIQLILEKKIQ